MRILRAFVALSLCSPVFAQIDLAGEWAPRFHEDQPERIPGPEIGDYLGLPITDAARLRADSWDASLLTLPEHQCKPHPSDYGPRGPANLRLWKEVDTATQQTIAWHTHISWQAPSKTIWMDGRPHPGPNAPAHLAALLRLGAAGRHSGRHHDASENRLDPPQQRPRSDRATLTEHWIRHGNALHSPASCTIPYPHGAVHPLH